jgi:purine-binding chemotaxis protein CheW
VSIVDFVTVQLDGHEFGIPVADVRDVLRRQKITPVPRAPRAVAGLLNLRGRIVTAIDLRIRLGLDPREAGRDDADVVVELGGEFYALSVDAVGDVMRIASEALEPVPSTLDPLWRDVATGIYPTEGSFIVLFDVARLLDILPKRATG